MEHFTIKVHARSYANATDAKSGYNKQCTLVEAFNYCNNRTLNESRPKVADGECSEFNFFQKIQDLTLSYILIIDESESSVDNIFLKNEINKSIKEMAEIIPVVISAHNKFHGARVCDIY